MQVDSNKKHSEGVKIGLFLTGIFIFIFIARMAVVINGAIENSFIKYNGNLTKATISYISRLGTKGKYGKRYMQCEIQYIVGNEKYRKDVEIDRFEKLEDGQEILIYYLKDNPNMVYVPFGQVWKIRELLMPMVATIFLGYITYINFKIEKNKK